MPGNAIGTGSIVLTANADGLASGLQKASADTAKWAGGMKGKVAQAAGGGGFMSSVADKLGGLARSAFSPAGIAIGGALGAAAGFAMVDEIKGIAGQGKIADSLGLSAEQFTGMAGVAKSVGSDTKDFIEGMATLSGKAMDAAAGKGEDSVAVFQKLGVDAAVFQKLGMEDQFYGLFEALNKVENPAERFNLLMKATGEDTGKNLLGILGKSTGELKSMAAGFAVSTAEMEKSKKASAAFASAEQAIAKLWRTVAVAAAPVLEMIAGGVKRLQPLFDWFGRALAAIGEIEGRIFAQLGTWISEAVDWLGEMAAEVGIFGGSWPTIEEVVTGVFRAIGIAGAYTWDTLKAGMGVFAVGVGFVVKALGAMIDLFARVVATAKNLPANLKPAGLDRFIKGVEDARDGVRGSGSDIKKWGDDAIAGWGKSADKVRAWFDKPITPVVKPVVVPPNASAIAADTTPLKFGAAIEARTREAYSLILKNSMRGDGAAGDPLKQQLAEAKKQTAHLGKIAAGIDAMKEEGTV